MMSIGAYTMIIIIIITRVTLKGMLTYGRRYEQLGWLDGIDITHAEAIIVNYSKLLVPQL